MDLTRFSFCVIVLSNILDEGLCKGKLAKGKTAPKKIKTKPSNEREEPSSSSRVWEAKHHYVSPEGAMPPPNYDPTESGHHDQPLHVNLTLWIESVIDVDLSSMEYTIHAYVIMEWFDLRLAGVRNHSVVLRDRSLLFLPDPYCVNCRNPSFNANSNEFQLRVYPDGFIFYSQSVTLSPTCRMNLRHFPFDWHRCKLEISSYAHNDSYIKMKWSREVAITETELQQFTVTGNVKKFSTVQSYIPGNFTIMQVLFEIKREQGFYVLQVYIPCIILVLMSWIIFYMSPEQIGDRLAIGVTLILTMIFLLGYVNGSLPKVSYIKAIDWYMIAALFLISTSLIETVFVYWHWNYYTLKAKAKEAEEENSQTDFQDEDGMSDEGDTKIHTKPHLITLNGESIALKLNGLHMPDAHLLSPESAIRDSNRREKAFHRRRTRLSTTLNHNITRKLSKHMQKPKASKTLDTFSRIFFPLMFAVYNIAYFSKYMSSNDFFNDSS